MDRARRPRDRFAVGFADQSDNELCYSNLQEGTSFVVDEAVRAECTLNFDTAYRWYVYVANGDWNGGVGLSYFYQNVILRPQAASQASPYRSTRALQSVWTQRHHVGWLPGNRP